MYAARRSGLKREMFGYVDGGYDARARRACSGALDAGGVHDGIRRAGRAGARTAATRVEVDAGRRTVVSFDQVVADHADWHASRGCARSSPRPRRRGCAT